MATDKLTKRKLSPKLTVEITEERIADSTRRSSSHCMIAEALRDLLPNTCKSIVVDLYSAAFTDTQRNLRYSYQLPRSAQLALIDFDQGNVPEPFSFVLQRARQINRRRPSGTVGTRTNAEYQRQKRVTRRSHEQSTKAVMTAINDPNAPLHGPVAVTHNRDPMNDTNGTIGTIVGGRMPPKNNFARSRRFGLRTLAV